MVRHTQQTMYFSEANFFSFSTGYFIPAGTIVVPNVHAMSKIGADRPKEFIPERFLEEDPTKRPTDPFSYIFGFGRRFVLLSFLAYYAPI